MSSKVVALIPARSGSKRIPNKNIAPLAGHPMLAYTVRSAIESGVFDCVICATDSRGYSDIATYYGAEVPLLRSPDISGDRSADIEWVQWILRQLKALGRQYEVFSILRPTNPFRSAATIKRAWQIFSEDPKADSLRAVEKCKQHPGKMWIAVENRMHPLLPFSINGVPWHSSQYASLPDVYVQNASLEIAWSRTVLEHGSIAGEVVIPFISHGFEGFDINEPEDFLLAESYLARGDVKLPKIKLPSFYDQ